MCVCNGRVLDIQFVYNMPTLLKVKMTVGVQQQICKQQNNSDARRRIMHQREIGMVKGMHMQIRVHVVQGWFGSCKMLKTSNKKGEKVSEGEESLGPMKGVLKFTR